MVNDLGYINKLTDGRIICTSFNPEHSVNFLNADLDVKEDFKNCSDWEHKKHNTYMNVRSFERKEDHCGIVPTGVATVDILHSDVLPIGICNINVFVSVNHVGGGKDWRSDAPGPL